MNQKEKISAVILAAGFSQRMNRDKFALNYDDRRCFLEKIIDDYLDIDCNEIVVVLNSKGMVLKNALGSDFPDKIKFVLNAFPEKERFYSVKTGLSGLSHADFVFIQNVDNPFINQALLIQLYKNRNRADWIVPVYVDKGGHPILISRNIVEDIVHEKNTNWNLKDFLKTYRSTKIQVDCPDILININDSYTYNKLFDHIPSKPDEQIGKRQSG